MRQTSKKISKRLALVAAVSLSIASIVVPFFLWYLQKQAFQIMGDIEVLGFNTNGWIGLDSAVSSRFAFIGGNYSVNLPAEDCQIDSIRVIKGKEKGSAFYDSIIFNATGRFDIQANNISFFFYDTLRQNSTGIMRFGSEETQSFLSPSGYPKTEIVFWFKSGVSKEISISLLEGNRRELSLDFGADDGSLNIVGSQNFTLPLRKDRAGILLTVSIPKNRGYTTQISGEPDQIYVDNWERVSMLFLHGTENVNSFKAFYPKGELAYDGRTHKAFGGQDLNFTCLWGAVHILPSPDPGLFRILIAGEIESILLGERANNLLEKSPLDILFPLPVLGASLLFGVVISHFWSPRPDVILIPPTLLFFLGSLVWAIRTEQPLWLQNLFSYSPLFITVIIYLFGERRKKEEKATKPDIEVNTSREADRDRENIVQKTISDLVEIVDSQYEEKRFSRKKFGIWVVMNLLAILLVIYLVFLLRPSTDQPAIYIPFFLGVLTIYLALLNNNRIDFGMDKGEMIQWNYEKLKDAKEKEQPYLLALIKMKSTQPRMPLSKAMKDNQSLFEPKKLIEMLYE